mmetsp:Transcript_3335/g.8635  ORF Transcript_3335/g.8635 Transcript_3335/m.8635 type:complete len:172 (+) Transcript_3335:198-713(+)
MGSTELKAGNRLKAKDHLLEYVRIRKEHSDERDIDFVNTLQIIGQIQKISGEDEAAETTWEEAFETYTDEGLAYEYPNVGETLRNLLDGESADAVESENSLFKKASTGILAMVKAQKAAEQANAPSRDDIVQAATFVSIRSLGANTFTSKKSLDTNAIMEGEEEYDDQQYY